MSKKNRRPREQRPARGHRTAPARQPRADPPGAAFGLFNGHAVVGETDMPSRAATVPRRSATTQTGGTAREGAADLTDLWPEFLGPPVDPRDEKRSYTTAEELQALLESVFVRRAEQLLTWLGSDRPVTGGELRKSDVTELVQLLGLVRRPPRRMRNVPELELLWASLVGAELIEVGPTMARPGAGLVPWPTDAASEPEEDRIQAGRRLLTQAFAYFFSTQGDTAAALEPTLTYTALISAAQPDGLRIEMPDDLFEIWDRGEDPDEEVVVEDLDRLVNAGLLTCTREVYRLPLPFLRPLFLAADALIIATYGTRADATGGT